MSSFSFSCIWCMYGLCCLTKPEGGIIVFRSTFLQYALAVSYSPLCCLSCLRSRDVESKDHWTKLACQWAVQQCSLVYDVVVVALSYCIKARRWRMRNAQWQVLAIVVIVAVCVELIWSREIDKLVSSSAVPENSLSAIGTGSLPCLLPRPVSIF